MTFAFTCFDRAHEGSRKALPLRAFSWWNLDAERYCDLNICQVLTLATTSIKRAPTAVISVSKARLVRLCRCES